jgi:hypothetical protein
MPRRTIAFISAALVVTGCDSAAGPTPAATPISIPGTLASIGAGNGAWVIREGQDCFLPGIDANGLPYPLMVPCQLQLVLTGNGRAVGSGYAKAQVPNASGRAVRLRFGPVSPFPCFFVFDTDGDGVIDVFKETTRYTGVVAASGRLHLGCHFPDD